ncbi:MAG: hypothetical protein HY562_12980, partial [Ignavibacteriales bacterium]|nr:hypothetical protein [Ignavibacteriales bacterium]
MKFRLVTLLSLTIAAPVVSQTKWFKYESNPVLDHGPVGSWDDVGVFISSVIVEKGIYRAWYTGEDGKNRRIGYATSRDGLSWKKHPSPVLDIGIDASWEAEHVIVPDVIFTGSQYVMWYSGVLFLVSNIGYAVSDDGIHWSRAE